MALDALVRYVGQLCARKLVNLYELGARCDWEAEDITAFLRCQRKPSAKMLRDLERELECSDGYLRQMLER